MRDHMWCHLVAALTLGVSASACEVNNPIATNQERAQARAPQVPEAVGAAARDKAPVEAAKIDPPNPPKKLKKIELNDRMRAALKRRMGRRNLERKDPDDPQGIKAMELPSKAGGGDGQLTSKDFTELEPDPASTATTPPEASDLARYTKDLEGDGPLQATIETTMGEFECELYGERAPITVANFVGLSRGLKAWKHPRTGKVHVGVPLYQDVLFHRVIPGFMIQGGDPMGQGTGNPGYQIPDEFDESLRHDTGGLLSMANAGPNTGGSQFFVTEVSTPHLDDRHAIFGKCDDVGLVKEIAQVKTGARNRPVEPVKIKKITISRGS